MLAPLFSLFLEAYYLTFDIFNVTVEKLYEGLLRTVYYFDMSDGARYSLDRGRRTARLTHRIGDYASRHA